MELRGGTCRFPRSWFVSWNWQNLSVIFWIDEWETTWHNSCQGKKFGLCTLPCAFFVVPLISTDTQDLLSVLVKKYSIGFSCAFAEKLSIEATFSIKSIDVVWNALQVFERFVTIVTMDPKKPSIVNCCSDVDWNKGQKAVSIASDRAPKARLWSPTATVKEKKGSAQKIGNGDIQIPKRRHLSGIPANKSKFSAANRT